MIVPITEELRSICRRIVQRGYSEAEWAARTGSDAFQTENYVGGFDGLENEFCFSYRPKDQEEQWFQFSLATAKRLAEGEEMTLEGRPVPVPPDEKYRALPQGEFAAREEWARAYFLANPEAHPLEMIGDYNGTPYFAKFGSFTLREAQLISNQVRSGG